MSTVFFTGFPGFLGVELLPRVLRRSPEDRAVCLVQPKFAALAAQRAGELCARDPGLEGRIQLVEGDITVPDLGLDDPAAGAAEVSEVWHLAAVYDLDVPREVGLRVNVEGTRNVLDFAERARGLRRFQYVSTCYVSGRHAGAFAETDLDRGQSFNNAYEETKFLAEVEVQVRRANGMPTTIYRPAIVVGDSTTGATQKYDGPYFVLQWLLRQPRLAIMPVIGDPRAHRLNVVPRDFVVSAIAELGAGERGRQRIYQLADPDPLSVSDVLDEMARATGRRLLRVPLPAGLAKLAIDHMPGVSRLLRIPSSAIDYFVHPTRYLTTNAEADLASSGVVCPRLPSYLPALVRFMREHPDITPAAMR